MLQNAYFLAKIGADTTENEQHFAEILPTDALRRAPLGRRRGRLLRGGRRRRRARLRRRRRRRRVAGHLLCWGI